MSVTINTDIAGTTQSILQASVPASQINTASLPSITFYPQITSTGNYTVTLLVPGCVTVGDCSTRTSTSISVLPYLSANLATTLIPPNQVDLQQVIYTGPVQRSDSTFVPVVVLEMSQNPSGVNGDVYTVVADRVQFKLTSLDTTGMGSGSVTYSNGTIVGGNGSSMAGGISQNSTQVIQSFGVYEWRRSDGLLDATSSLSNQTETSLDNLGILLDSALGSTEASIVSCSVVIDSTQYIAGTFSTPSYANILAFSPESNITSLAASGLDGPVHAMLAGSSSTLFVGGEFTATASSSSRVDLLHLAKYDVSSSSWSSLAGGVNGPVTSLSLSPDSKTLTVAGNFTSLLSSNGSSTSSGGIAFYDVSSSMWSSANSFIVGNVSALVATTSSSSFFAGRISGAASFAAQGFATLSSSSGQPQLSTVPLSFQSVSSSDVQMNARRASTLITRSPIVWLPSFASPVTAFRRAFASTTSPVDPIKRQSSSNIVSIPRASSPSPAILAAAFYSNAKYSIVGGNFTSNLPSGQGQVSNLAIYDKEAREIKQLEGGSKVEGVVRSLIVVEDRLFVGGDFKLSGNVTEGNGFGVYDLKEKEWVSGIPALPGKRSISCFAAISVVFSC